jgi:hypothetical protein
MALHPARSGRYALLGASMLSILGCASPGPNGDGDGTPTSPPATGAASVEAGAPVVADAASLQDGASDADAGAVDGNVADASGCATDEDCNHGIAGEGVVCSFNGTTTGTCIVGCHRDTDCPTNDICDEQASPHWACVPANSGVSSTDAGPALGNAIAKIALANVGEGACSTNTLGGTAFGSSCTGNGGEPEYWCADFALWVWSAAAVEDVAGLTAAAGSFYVYGQDHGTLSSKPRVGDAVIFDYQGGGVADHVAIVTQVNPDGSIETASGDWGGQSGSEAEFSSTSSVVLNAPAYLGTEGSSPAIMGMTISGYVTPVAN